MLVIGLSGGIASGKTTISDLFSSLGITIIDTDIISRRLLEPGYSGFQQIVKKLGSLILLDDGNIDRRKLRQQVFNDNSLKVWLESMLHPLIFQTARQQIQQFSKSPYIILVVPLLFETNFDCLADRVLVVDCAREIQLKRLVARDNIDQLLAEKMLDQQMSNQDRINRADDIIDNNGNFELAPQVNKLHQQYLAMTQDSRLG
jgi:dephospho-CoA kinase